METLPHEGVLSPSEVFFCGCVFVDHYIRFVSIKHQVVINATEIFKNFIKSYHNDNSIFNASYFIKNLYKKNKI